VLRTPLAPGKDSVFLVITFILILSFLIRILKIKFKKILNHILKITKTFYGVVIGTMYGNIKCCRKGFENHEGDEEIFLCEDQLRI